MSTRQKLYSIVIFCFIIISGCSLGKREAQRQIVAEVNDYKMTVDDLRYELKNIPYDDKALLETQEGRMEYLNRLLEKEILIQEAQRQGLDRNKDFMKQIENYWEQALLRLLLERKSKEISGSVHVYEDEMMRYYKESGETRPFSEVRDDIRRIIRQNKEQKAMNAWIEELRKKSYIKINKEVLSEALTKVD